MSTFDNIVNIKGGTKSRRNGIWSPGCRKKGRMTTWRARTDSCCGFGRVCPGQDEPGWIHFNYARVGPFQLCKYQSIVSRTGSGSHAWS